MIKIRKNIIIITIIVLAIIAFLFIKFTISNEKDKAIEKQADILNETDDIKKTSGKYFLLGDIEELRKKAYDTNPGTIGISSAEIFNRIKKVADDDIKNGPKMPIPEPSSPAESKAVSDRFWGLVINQALVYKITSEEKYLNRAKDLMKTVVEWKSWDHMKTGSNSLDRDAIMFGLSLSYNWLYEDLSLIEKIELREALVEKGITPVYKAFKSGTWPFESPGHNHYIAGVSALGIASLAIVQDEPKAQEALDSAIDGAKQFINIAGGRDGGYAESVLYGYFGLSRLYIFRDSLLEISNIDLLKYDQRDWIKKFNTFVIHSLFPDISSVVLFNDENIAVASEQFARCVKSYKDDDIAKKCQLVLGRIKKYNPAGLFSSAITFLNFNPYQATGKLDDLPHFEVFRDVNQAFYHADWNDINSLFIAIKAETHNKNFFPTNTAHSHYDGGQFVIYKNGNEYITDLGYQIGPCWVASKFCDDTVNEFTTKSAGHNNMMFDGIPQDTLASRITGNIGDKDLFYVATDLKDSYSKVGLKEYNREFIFVGDTLLTIDSFSANKKALKNYSYRLMTTKRDEKNGKIDAQYNTVSISGNSFDIHPYNGNEALHSKILYPSSVSISKEEFLPFKGEKGVEFIEETGEFKKDINYLINAFSFSDDKIISEDKGDYFLISIGGKKVFLSKKGSINIDTEEIKFVGKTLIITSNKALLNQAKYLSINGIKLYSSDNYENNIIKLK